MIYEGRAAFIDLSVESDMHRCSWVTLLSMPACVKVRLENVHKFSLSDLPGTLPVLSNLETFMCSTREGHANGMDVEVLAKT